MPTLAVTLGITTPVSVLVRKARRLGILSLTDALALAVNRGCRHYLPLVRKPALPVPRSVLSDEELTILLICGEHPYDLMAVRCAAQLARSTGASPKRLAQLAVRDKAERVLGHIARAGLAHDSTGHAFWQETLAHLPEFPPATEAALPHWTRFVSMPGRHRSQVLPPVWLTPSP